MSYMDVDLVETARSLSGQWLSEFGMTCPPVPVFEIAGLLGAAIVPQRMGIETMACRTASPERQIIVNTAIGSDAATWRKRARFAVAHEIMALWLPSGDGAESLGEPALQRCASELLLYRPWLADAMADVGGDLPELAVRFDASYEATARAMLDIETAVLTVVDCGQVTTRYATSGTAFPRELAAIERGVLVEVGKRWRQAEAREDGLLVRAWPVPGEGSVRRVVALTYADE